MQRYEFSHLSAVRLHERVSQKCDVTGQNQAPLHLLSFAINPI